ncbi:MAG: IPTL-CTERM sorting domain-containing protein [Rhodocyclaceae bacterium]|nr:MAG: IPTL-CTERM sorting domain-containing protein [Rhodocyclaceae bacterium]
MKIFRFLSVVLLLAAPLLSIGATAPDEVISRLRSGEVVDLIVEYDSAAIEQQAALARSRSPRRIDDDATLKAKANGYLQLKDRADTVGYHPDSETLKDYSHLPMRFRRFRSLSALERFLARPEVKAVFPDTVLHPVLAQSLPLINQPTVAAVGERGSGTTVAVIDNGIDYTNAAFGSCTSPGVPATCHVAASLLFGSGTTDNSHGTNVSAIVLGVAPDSRIAMLNAFSGNGAYTSDIVSAINWAIANRSTYNIVAINMSLGDATKNTSPCQNSNLFYSPVNNARNAGINVVAAAGNDTYTNALGKPACTPGVISVGAVYDSNIGGVGWATNPACTDATTSADLVTCFSDSASFLTLLAPGAMITAAGITQAGTSQASPHVAGAVAVLRATFPNETIDQIQARLTSTGTPVTDPRNGLVKPRLNLLEAARPGNNAFAARTTLSGSSGSTSGTDLLATEEAGEPQHAGVGGSHSVWWKWTAPAAGQLSINTHGSGFDTLLAVYTGNAVAALTPVASNDNDGSSGNASGLLFQAVAGTEYQIAVDGANNAAGSVALNWALNASAQANLSVGLSGPAGGSDGATGTYTLSVVNAGPQTATNVVATMTLPAGASYVSGPSSCTIAGNTVNCAIGTLTNGASIDLVVQIYWDSVVGPASISASTTSDLPDPNSADNSGSVLVEVSGNDGADAPTLPEWGMLLLATALIGMSLHRRRHQ